MERIHRNEQTTVRVKIQRCSFNANRCCVFKLSLLESDDQLGDDGEHIDLKSVEFIKTDPSAVGCETFEELGHRCVVNIGLTVEDEAVPGDVLSHLFD